MDRIIIGIRDEEDKRDYFPLFSRICNSLIWMNIESAEMTKHAINAFLATSVAFSNELAILSESVGANAKEVEAGMKSDSRIGKLAYLAPGNPFAGGTLARDINFLIHLSQCYNHKAYLFKAVKESNNNHKDWTKRKIVEVLKDLKDKKIAVLGLTYKAGTDTLRRSLTVELCCWLSEKGASIFSYDPNIQKLPKNLSEIISLVDSPEDTFPNASCIVIGNENPVFLDLDKNTIEFMSKNIIIDPGGYLKGLFDEYDNMNYFMVGRNKLNEIKKS